MQAHDGTRGRRVTLRVDGRYTSILRRELQIARDGRMEDLMQMPAELRDPARTRRQVEVYDRLLRQLATADVLTGESDALRAVLVDLSAGTDAAEEYARLAAEHRAFQHLLDQLDAAESDDA